MKFKQYSNLYSFFCEEKNIILLSEKMVEFPEEVKIQINKILEPYLSKEGISVLSSTEKPTKETKTLFLHAIARELADMIYVFIDDKKERSGNDFITNMLKIGAGVGISTPVSSKTTGIIPNPSATTKVIDFSNN